MNTEAFKLARATLKKAVREYGWRRLERRGPGAGTLTYRYGPGKFEGEHWSIVHFYDATLEGDGEPLYSGEVTAGTVLDVTPLERDAFGFGAYTDAVVIWHSDSGFESMQQLTEKEANELHRDYAEQAHD